MQSTLERRCSSDRTAVGPIGSPLTQGLCHCAQVIGFRGEECCVEGIDRRAMPCGGASTAWCAPIWSAEKLDYGDHPPRDFGEREVLVHRHLAQRAVGLVFRELALLHHDALRLLDQLP